MQSHRTMLRISNFRNFWLLTSSAEAGQDGLQTVRNSRGIQAGVIPAVWAAFLGEQLRDNASPSNSSETNRIQIELTESET